MVKSTKLKKQTKLPMGYDAVLAVVFMYQKGTDSFCDNHGTRYWKAIDKNLKKWVDNYIVHFDNDINGNKKYHCYVDYFGCIGVRTYDTDSYKDAVRWLNERLVNYR